MLTHVCLEDLLQYLDSLLHRFEVTDPLLETLYLRLLKRLHMSKSLPFVLQHAAAVTVVGKLALEILRRVSETLIIKHQLLIGVGKSLVAAKKIIIVA